MKIVSFVYCMKVENDEQGNPVIIKPIQMLTPQFLPTEYTFTVSFGLFDINPNEKNMFEISFTDSENHEIVKNKFTLPKISSKDIDMHKPLGLQINMEFKNVELLIEGEYKSTVKVNEDMLGVYPINVMKNG